MADRGKGFALPTVGGASLLTVFAVLCLTVFALLSLSTVRADLALSDVSAKAVRDYYTADGKAQKILARLRNGEFPGGADVQIIDSPEGSRKICSWRVSISETQDLWAEVEIRGANDYTVLRWQAVPAGEWVPDENPGFWDGEPF